MKILSTIISTVILFAMYWPTDDILIVGNINPKTIHIGEDVILSCQVINCRSSNLIVHLYKRESSGNKTLYIHNNTAQPSIQGSYSADRDKNRTQKGQYINGYLEVTLIKVEVEDAGQYVCALTCEDVYKEDTIEMIPRGIIDAFVGEEVILPCPLLENHELFYLKMQWTSISHGKRQTIYSYLLQNTCAAVYSEDTLGHRCTSLSGPSSRTWFGKRYRQEAEVFKGSELRNKNGYLKLKNVQEEDAGRYLYSVKSSLLHKDVILQLYVEALFGLLWELFSAKINALFVLLWELFSPKIIALFSLPLLELVFDKIIECRKHQKEVEKNQKFQKEVDNLNKEKRQWQVDKDKTDCGCGRSSSISVGPPYLLKAEDFPVEIPERKQNHAGSGQQPIQSNTPCDTVAKNQGASEGLQILADQQQTDKELQELKHEVEWRRACSNAESITLDADSAHLNLSINSNKKSFTYQPQPLSVSLTPQRFDGIVSILGKEGFSLGKHYWTVDTGDSSEWDLGVARRSIQRKGQFSISPKEGFWVLGRSGKDYWAKTEPWTRLVVQRKPSKIGVYLSFQPKEVTFFNVVEMSVLFVFRHCSFTEEILPFFKNTQKGTTMAICSIKEEKA